MRLASNRRGRSSTGGGSVLIIVLWVALGLVSVALYFANSMVMELRASDNRAAAFEADQAIDGMARYVAYILANPQGSDLPGQMPSFVNYQSQSVAIGDATVWLIGRDNQGTNLNEPNFGLVDESSKLNLNKATVDMLEWLPRMTPQLAASIVDWRDTNSDITVNGAESETYAQMRPPYQCKNAPFESVDELRLVNGATMEILIGEDANRNGVLDPNENDGEATYPVDNRNGKLEPGILEYLTVHTRQATTQTNGTALISVANAAQLRGLMQTNFGGAGIAMVTRAGAGLRSPLEFYIKSGMTAAQFAQIETNLVGVNVEGLINVNTASEAVLTCILTNADKAATLVSYRKSSPDTQGSVAWVKEALDRATALQIAPWVTGRTYQFSADIAAVGRYGRGYRRARFVFDTSEGTPKIVFRQDLSHLGWALGRDVRQTILFANQRK